MVLLAAGALAGVLFAPDRSEDRPIRTESVALETREGFYARALTGGGGEVDARVQEPGSSEVFTLIRR